MTIEGQLAKSGYSDSRQSTGSTRGIEYETVARVTRNLSTGKSGSVSYSEVSKALYDNLRLWSILMADVANDNNQLSAELRSKIFYLGEFTQQHTRKIFSGDANLDVLVQINTAIMRGLRGTAP